MALRRALVKVWHGLGVMAYRPLRAVTASVDAFSRVPRFAEREPDLEHPLTQLATQRQCESALFERWCREMLLPLDDRQRYHRKTWEFVYILQVLESQRLLRPGARGLGFGVGREPLAAVMAKRGCSVVATDLPTASAEATEWQASGQHADQLADLNPGGVCPADVFAERVRFQPMDMRAIDPSLRGFDFVWSSCALEHLGSLARGIQFIRDSLATLRPGGVAVHTTEYNVGSNSLTLPTGPVVLYRRRDVVRLANELRAEGHEIALNLHPGNGPIDRYVDPPPYYRREGQHLKLLVGPFAGTSLGIWIRKADQPAGNA